MVISSRFFLASSSSQRSFSIAFVRRALKGTTMVNDRASQQPFVAGGVSASCSSRSCRRAAIFDDASNEGFRFMPAADERLHIATSLSDALAALADRGRSGAPLAGATWIMRAPLREERQDWSY